MLLPGLCLLPYMEGTLRVLLKSKQYNFTPNNKAIINFYT